MPLSRHYFAPLFWWAAALFLSLSAASALNLSEEMRQATSDLKPLQEQLEKLVDQGKPSEANRKLLEFFPEATRTPAQKMVIANLLFDMDPKLSYRLHREVAELLPEEPAVMLEWAMEQHRAGDFAGALAAYDSYSKAQPNYAPVHGLAADCLIRLGKTREAVIRWKQSETATRGTLETLETLVCEVYKTSSPEQERERLRAKVQTGDIDAAVQLITLDCRFERDWWNNGPHRSHLLADLPLLDKFPANPRIKAAQCLGQCLLVPDPAPTEIHSLLARFGLLINPAKSLPSDVCLTSALLGVAIDTELLTRDQARQQFGSPLLAAASNSNDSTLWNVVAYLHIGTPPMASIEKRAWEATNDPRFAAGYLNEQLINKVLKPNDLIALEARKLFPEDSAIAAATLGDQPTLEMLEQAIKAEYRHFSSSSGSRPSARPLRSYFSRLAKLLP